jgi:hypothetical protein
MASLIAQCTDEARRSGGSPDAANKNPKHIMSRLQATIVGEFQIAANSMWEWKGIEL